MGGLDENRGRKVSGAQFKRGGEAVVRARGHQTAQPLPAEQRGGEELEENPAKNKKQGVCVCVCVRGVGIL